MPSENPENSIDEIIDGAKEDPRVESLKALLKTVVLNRCAIGILRALETGDRIQVSSLALEAKRAGIAPDALKAACRAMKR